MLIDPSQWISPAEAARRLEITDGRVAQLRVQGRLDILPTPLGNLISVASVERYRIERTPHRARVYGVTRDGR